MRTSLRLLLAAVMVIPILGSSVAQAQYVPMPPPPPPMFAPVPPHVYIHQRVRWHHYRHMMPGVWVAPGPAPVWIAPAPPSPPPPPVYVAPPPVVIQPQQPVYVQPQPIYVPPPVTYAPAPMSAPMIVRPAPVLPQWQSRFGFGATVEGLYTSDLVTDGNTDSNTGFGVLGQLRFRAARHLSLELMGGYERSNDSNSQTRRDVPITFGLIIPFLGPEYALTPYIVGATGLNFADVKLIDSPTYQLDDSRTQAVAQLGGGLELHLGQHFAINADVRGEWRWNLGQASDAVKNTTSIDGKPVTPIQDSVGVRVGLGGTVYF